jgi:hypothetical protein
MLGARQRGWNISHRGWPPHLAQDAQVEQFGAPPNGGGVIALRSSQKRSEILRLAACGGCGDAQSKGIRVRVLDRICQPPKGQRMPDAPDQILIGGHERGRLLLGFERFAQDQRDGRCLIMGCFGLDERHAGDRAALSLPFISGIACPSGCRRSRAQRLAEKRRAAKTFAPHCGRKRGEVAYGLAAYVEPRQKLMQPVLRVLWLIAKHSPGLGVQMAVEPVKHDRRVRPPFQRLHQRHGGGHACPGTGDNDRGIALPDELGFDRHEPVAPFLPVELVCPQLVGSPAFSHGPEKLEGKLLASGSL